jgi:membrane-bound lytic murein transglycosylase D
MALLSLFIMSDWGLLLFSSLFRRLFRLRAWSLLLFFSVSVATASVSVENKAAHALNSAVSAPLVNPAKSPVNLWQAMRAHFSFRQDYNLKAVVQQRKWYLSHLPAFKIAINNAIPYLSYVYQRSLKNQVPVEIALLPLVESDYNPFAYSRSGASGLWQLMPQTASLYGLNSSWWYDSRRDVLLSTRVALSYLKQLHQQFGDWYLALTAYHSGPAFVSHWSSSLKRGLLPSHYWDDSHSHYVVKLLAIASIIDSSKSYGIQLPALTTRPLFTTINLHGQFTLPEIAEFSGTSINLVRYLNPALLRSATSNHGDYILLLPNAAAAKFVAQVNKRQGQHYLNWMFHQVQPQETLADLASEFHVSINELKEINALPAAQLSAGLGVLVPVDLGKGYLPITIRPSL